MFQTNSFMAQKKINYLHNTKYGLVSVAWENIVSALGAATVQNRESIDIFLFIYILLISCISLLFWIKYIYFWCKNIQNAIKDRLWWNRCCHGYKLKWTRTRRCQQRHQCNWCRYWCWNGFKQLCHLRKINVITGTQNIPLALTAITGGTQD